MKQGGGALPLVHKDRAFEVWIFIEDDPEKAVPQVTFYDDSLNELVLNLENFKLVRISDDARGTLVNQAYLYLYANYSELRELWDEYNPGG